MKPYQAVVVGLGGIGQSYDGDPDSSDAIRTHAKAFSLHADYQLVAGVDPDPEMRAAFTRRYHAPAFSDYQSLRSLMQPDIVAVATPTIDHFQTCMTAFEGNPKAVICEKPLAATEMQGQELLAVAAQRGISVAVNYIRAFDPGFVAARDAIRSGKIGTIHKGVIWYSNGLRHAGTHVLDLMRFWLDVDHVDGIDIIDAGRLWQGDDPEPDFVLRVGEAKLYFLAARHDDFPISEASFIGTKGRIQMVSSASLRLQLMRTHPDMTGFTELDPVGLELPTELNRYQWNVIDQLAQHLKDGNPLNSTGETGQFVLRLTNDIIRQMEAPRV